LFKSVWGEEDGVGVIKCGGYGIITGQYS